jgi:hypothetical protein
MASLPGNYRLITFFGGTFLRGVQGNPNFFSNFGSGCDAVHGIQPKPQFLGYPGNEPAPARASVKTVLVLRIQNRPPFLPNDE